MTIHHNRYLQAGLAAVLAGMLLLCTACGQQDSVPQETPQETPDIEQPQPESPQPQPPQSGSPENAEIDVSQENPEETFSFADVANLEFYFSSGAGAWRTVLYIHEDGSFDGEYLDSDLILSYYGDAFEMPDFTKISDYCVYIDESDANVIIDVGVFKLSDASYADTLINFIKARIADKREDYDEYATIDIETLDAAIVKKSGSYVYYSVSYDVEDIIKDIEAALK